MDPTNDPNKPSVQPVVDQTASAGSATPVGAGAGQEPGATGTVQGAPVAPTAPAAGTDTTQLPPADTSGAGQVPVGEQPTVSVVGEEVKKPEEQSGQGGTI